MSQLEYLNLDLQITRICWNHQGDHFINPEPTKPEFTRLTLSQPALSVFWTKQTVGDTCRVAPPNP